MDSLEKIRMARAKANISQAELARRLNITPQAMHSKLKSDKFSYADLEEIAQALGAKYVSYFEFEDGTRI